MDIGKCSNCEEALETGYTLCWQCGTCHVAALQDQSPANDSAPAKIISKPMPDRNLDCLRCKQPMRGLRRMKFHEEIRVRNPVSGSPGESPVHRESFDVYVCKTCGKTEFYISDQSTAGEA